MKPSLSIAILFLLLCCAYNHAVAQTFEECGTDRIHEKQFVTDSIYRREFLLYEHQLKSAAISPAQRKSAIITIPVVVHVLHVGESPGLGSNISDAQIMSAIQGATDRFRNVIGNGVDTEIEFCLAVRDPDCNPTNGINRIDASAIPNYAAFGINYDDTVGVDDEVIKDLSKWSFEDYINIWVVNDIQGAAAYANFPSASNEYQGIVIQDGYMRQSSETLAHEIGHYLNLGHTFNGDDDGAQCPDDADCTDDGDRVCDTPPHKRGDCSTLNPCSSFGIWDNSRNNYMSYCNNRILFTQGQKDRMLLSLNTHSARIPLLNSLGCTPVQATCFAYDLKQVTTTSSTSLTWSSDCVADNFTLEYRAAGESDWIEIDSATPPYSVDTLPCRTDYEWRVQATCDTSASAFSQIDSFYMICPGIQTQNHEVLNLKIYPNPGNGMFNVSATAFTVDDWLVKIQDITGRVLYEKQFLRLKEINERIQLNAPPGVYFLQVNNASQSTSELVIVH